MAEQDGNRIPKTPNSPAWEGQDPTGAADPNSGDMGGGWSTPSVSEAGAPEWESHPAQGGTFSGSK